ncbi:c-type cytochrome [Sulfurimonas sp. CS5]|uniref:c-type cytochrome n=1 Tax=Sulfurimonas sp. CS5 TaxID=3391145 RepID=UPI0039E782A8
MRTYKIQCLVYTLSLLLIAGVTGCSDNKEEKQVKKETSTKTDEALKIEVVQNKDAHAIKVKVKENDKSQSKSYYYDYNIKSAYDENSRPANVDASVRVKPRTNIDANMNVRSPYDKVQVSMLVKKLSKEFIVKCSACHNDYANGVIGPSLLGKDYEYIYNKIISFKTGKKSNPLMNDLVKMMDDAKIKKLAHEIYEFNKEINEMRNK